MLGVCICEYKRAFKNVSILFPVATFTPEHHTNIEETAGNSICGLDKSKS